MKKVLAFALVVCSLAFGLEMAILAMDFKYRLSVSENRYEEQGKEMNILRKILVDEYESGTNRCSSLDLLITCYEEVNELRSLNQ